MSPFTSKVLRISLIAGGSSLCAVTVNPLAGVPELDYPSNPMGINRSPYGEMIAIGMQGSVELYFHGGVKHKHAPGEPCGAECGGGQDHDHDHDHDHDAVHENPVAEEKKDQTPGKQAANWVLGMDRALGERNNPKAPSAALQFYWRRKTEDRLRVAYALDPSNYSNFACYHFFLSESALGTRPEMRSSASRLALMTIDYCLKQEGDPRACLTAIVAAESLLEKRIEDFKSGLRKPSLEEFQRDLALVDRCFSHFERVYAGWEASGGAMLVSAVRQQEIQERLIFLKNMRAAQEQIVYTLHPQKGNAHPNIDPRIPRIPDGHVF